MDRPGTSSQQTDKVEMFEVREHVPYQAELTRAPTTYDEESGDGYDSRWSSAWKAICQLFNMIHHMMVAIVVFCLWNFALTAESNGSVSNLQLHIVFSGTGYQLFLVEAVLTLHRHNSWSSHLSRDGKRVVHGCLQLTGGVFIIAGTFLALAEVDMRVDTPHGVCGIIAFTFTLLSMISGVVTLFSSKVRLFVKNGPMKLFHIAVGLFSLSLGLITMTLGFNMSYFKAGQENLATALMTFVVMILMYLLIQPIVDLVSTTRSVM